MIILPFVQYSQPKFLSSACRVSCAYFTNCPTSHVINAQQVNMCMCMHYISHIHFSSQ